MVYYIISILFFIGVFVRYPGSAMDWNPNIVETWIWDKSGGYGTKAFSGLEDPTKTLNGYKSNNRFFSFSSEKSYPIQENTLIEYPQLDEGFYEYQKLGKEVSYYNGYKELFWKKSFSSYPRPGYYTSVIPLVSGDGNTVFFADRNGNLSGEKSVDGRFTVDICYATEAETTMILFSGGEYFLLDENANVIMKHNEESVQNHKTTYFAKSCSISPTGDYIGLHFQSGNEDYIQILDRKKGNSYTQKISKIHPFKLHFALNNRGDILLIQPDSIILSTMKGDILKQIKNNELNQYYNPVIYKDGFYYWAETNSIQIWNEKGLQVRSIIIPGTYHPIRFLPGRNKGTVYIETQKDIRQIVHFDTNRSHK